MIEKESNILKWVTGGGIAAAIMSSLCCIGPLLLGAIGIGGASSILFLEEYREIIIGLVIVLIGRGWIMNYRLEKKECKDGAICVDPKKKKLRRVGLGISSFIALFFIFSPFLLSSLSKAQNKTLSNEGKVKTLYIEGMTCGGCEMGVRKALKRAGLNEDQILSVDHNSPNPKDNIGSAVIKLSESLGCEVIKEIKKSPGYIAYWSFDDKNPCQIDIPKSSELKEEEVDSVTQILSSSYDPKMNKICQKGCAEKSINYKKEDIVENGHAEVGQVTRCPVSGVIFKVKKRTPTIKHKGKSYQFCCNSCAGKFNRKVGKS